MRVVCRAIAGLTVAFASIPLAGLVATPRAGAASVGASAYWVKAGAPVPTAPTGGIVVGDDPTAAVNPAQPPPLPVAPPPLPSIPGPQLYGYTAVSALRIVGLPAAIDKVTLTLTSASGSVPPLPTVSTIVACPIPDTGWKVPAGGEGDIASAPAANCGTPSVGRGGSGNSLSFLLPASFQTTPGELDIEFLPGTSVAPAPFLATFNAPKASDITAAAGGPLPSAPAVIPPTEIPANPIASPDTGGVVASPPPAIPSASTPSVATPSAPSSNGSSLPAVSQLANVSVPGVTDDRAHRIMAVVLLFAVAAAWWWLGGRTARAPRRLGALAVEGHTRAENVGGIGRFRRVRTTRAPRV